MTKPHLAFTKSQAFTDAIEQIVPGGAHTYSKGRDQFPAASPNGIKRGIGCRIWDADDNELIDWGMGLSSVSLGHGHPEVTEAVCSTIRDGVNFTRPAQLELDAAQDFLSFSGDEMVKFAKHGSSVTTAAVKLARAFTGRSKVAMPKEHPFFSFDDWFIGTTLANFGIPDELKQFSLTFSYNHIDTLDQLIREHGDDIACVIMEPVKFDPPEKDFLQAVRERCTDAGIVLIMDEMITGLKMGMPGASARFGIAPDLTTWGKGIANGFSCAALAGRGDIMRLGGLDYEGSRKLFLLSTTHGAESGGLAAMQKTLEIYKRDNTGDHVWRIGSALQDALNATFKRHGLEDHLRVYGYPCNLLLETLGPDGNPDFGFRTLILQEVIRKNILTQGVFISTPSHSDEEVRATNSAFDEACNVYCAALAAKSVDGFLDGPAIKPVFRPTV